MCLVTNMAAFSFVLQANSKVDYVGRMWHEREGETGSEEKLCDSL